MCPVTCLQGLLIFAPTLEGKEGVIIMVGVKCM